MRLRTASTGGRDVIASALQRALTGDGLVTLFQPIVSLPDRTVIGHEALSRWPTLGFDNPTAMFEHAAATGRIDDLERLCVDKAFEAAHAAGLSAGAVLSLNTEAASAPADRRTNPVVERGAEQYQVMFEVTERNLLAHPASLLAKVDALRSDGFAIALDDVGSRDDACATLDVIRPDVIKLDLALVQRSPTIEQARVLTSVMAYRERNPTIILAEGIENATHLEHALALGADLGQGYLFGYPSARPAPLGDAAWSLPATSADTSYLRGTPFDSVADSGLTRATAKDTLLAFSRALERHVGAAADHQIVLAATQDGEFFSGDTRRTYTDLAADNPLVAIFANAVPDAEGTPLRMIDLAAEESLTAQWLVIALGGHTAVALLAREQRGRTDTGPDRLFDFLITHDRSIVANVARNLLARIS